MTGRTIAQHRILEQFGEGGMGVVYKARDTHLDRFVALKVLPPGKVADPERKQRFVQEAKAASALNHPNIITIYDIDQAGGVDFILMESVAGNTRDRLIPRHGIRLSGALECAHPDDRRAGPCARGRDHSPEPESRQPHGGHVTGQRGTVRSQCKRGRKTKTYV